MGANPKLSVIRVESSYLCFLMPLKNNINSFLKVSKSGKYVFAITLLFTNFYLPMKAHMNTKNQDPDPNYQNSYLTNLMQFD